MEGLGIREIRETHAKDEKEPAPEERVEEFFPLSPSVLEALFGKEVREIGKQMLDRAPESGRRLQEALAKVGK